MDVKRKICKGRNKAASFNGCGEFSYLERYGLCKQCFIEWIYSTGEGGEYLKKMVIPAAKKKVSQDWKERKASFKAKNKTRTQKINEVKVIFQRWIRERDKDLPCVSCGTESTDLWDGGHYLKAEVYTGLIFNENNVHKQCRKCNRYEGGKEIEYRIGLCNRIGEDEVKRLESIKDELRTYTWTDEELQEIKTKYKNYSQKSESLIQSK